MPKGRAIFITGTDTGVGKTVAAFVLSTLLKAQGRRIGMIKPTQCGGHDAQFLKALNPFYAPEPLSPHLAFRRAKVKFHPQRIQDCVEQLRSRCDIVLVEGAGGLMVPLTDTYFNADLIADLKASAVIVSRLGLGTINHTLLTISELRRRKLHIEGVLFSQPRAEKPGLAEKTNPMEINKLSGIKVLGTIPYLKPLHEKNVLRRCKNLKLPV